MQVVGSIFDGAGREGDFAWMIQQERYARALFVFNDNEEQFLAYRRDPTSRSGCAPGGGNATIRPYRCQQPPRAAGIPTGAGGRGYEALTVDVQARIDEAIEVIEALLATGHYDAVVYSSDGHGGLGTGIFRVAEGVKAYIVERLEGLAEAKGG
ncbi:MAG: hypothetical protein ACYTG6_00540 [Planctomycetota bacterium]|jgi:hypothetical protein